MRVIHVAPTPFGSSGLFGGGERYPLELARALAREIDCTLISFAPQASQFREPGGLKHQVLRTVYYHQSHPAHPFAVDLPFALRGGDLIHTHHMRSLPSKVAATTANLWRQPVVVTDHGLQGGDLAGLLPRLFARFLAVSQYSARELGAPLERTHIIYGGADPERYAPDDSERRDGVLFVGRLTPHKGVDRLIAALPPNARLRVAGSEGHDPDPPENGYPALLRKLAAGKNVEFLGPVADRDLPALYRRSSLLVLPSVERTCYGRMIRVSELLGLVVLEAMASGTPVIASRIGGLPEIVEHGVTGFLVTPGDEAELRERLAQLLGDPELASRMGAAARQSVVERFTWQACAERCLAVYQELL